MDFLEPRKQKKLITPGPVESKEGIPYDYIVVIDAGSKGSRVYVYNWLNPVHIFQNDVDLNDIAENKELKLVRRFFIDSVGGRDNDEDSDLENEDNEESDNTDKEKEKGKEKGKDKDKDNKKGKSGDQDKEKDKPKEPEKENTRRLPLVGAKKKWNKKIKPGISSFNSSPQKIGNHHLKHLLQLASIVVPKSQHSRTPIFLHSTGGMRLLPPTEQQQILENICKYITHNSDFFIPECSTHVNVIDGDIEGLYGWLSINYLIGALDNPQNHQHGKNHTTYGLLDMGGASTQVVFQPNSTEVREHDNNLFKVKLVELPTPISDEQDKEQTGKNEDSIGSFNTPSDLSFDIYSDSFLGFGMYQAHNRYLSFLTEKYAEEHELNKPTYYGSSRTPVPDPCLPKGYTTKSVINDDSVNFTGESDFNKCLTSIFPVLRNSTHNTGSGKNENCKEFKDSDESSSCLLNDLIPAFDFDVNHFVGVSGYWDAITNLLSYDDKSTRDSARSSDKSGGKDAADTYDYKVIYNATSKLCSQSFSRLIELNNVKPEKNQMTEEELSDLCFKSSWILNFLHLGLGFPRFGIDEYATENSRFKSLELVEKLGGSSFSWTLGRAILYANDEYVQAFNNFTADTIGLSEEDRITSKNNIPRSGFYHSASSSVFHFGAEQSGIFPRPQFSPPIKNAKYPIFDYETEYQSEYKESKWYIEPHRWYGSLVFMSLIGFILWLLMGKSGRAALFDNIKNKITSFFNLVKKGRTGNSSYFRLNNDAGNDGDLELADFELNGLSHNHRSASAEEADHQFKIDSDED